MLKPYAFSPRQNMQTSFVLIMQTLRGTRRNCFAPKIKLSRTNSLAAAALLLFIRYEYSETLRRKAVTVKATSISVANAEKKKRVRQGWVET